MEPNVLAMAAIATLPISVRRRAFIRAPFCSNGLRHSMRRSRPHALAQVSCFLLAIAMGRPRSSRATHTARGFANEVKQSGNLINISEGQSARASIVMEHLRPREPHRSGNSSPATRIASSIENRARGSAACAGNAADDAAMIDIRTRRTFTRAGDRAVRRRSSRRGCASSRPGQSGSGRRPTRCGPNVAYSRSWKPP
jgi:hypothetical protein